MMVKNKNKVCLIGSAPSKADAPYHDESFDIWAISGAAFSRSLGRQTVPETPDEKWNTVHRVDVFFEMHKRQAVAERWPILAAVGKPVIMLCREPEIPTSMAYPLADVIEDVGEDFTSSVAYMMALAIHLQYEEVRLYGINLLHDTEYATQRPAVAYYRGIARERGITVWAPDFTHLATPAWRYGYDDVDYLIGQLEQRKQSLEDAANKQKQEVENARQIFFQYRGAAGNCDDLIAALRGGL